MHQYFSVRSLSGALQSTTSYESKAVKGYCLKVCVIKKQNLTVLIESHSLKLHGKFILIRKRSISEIS